MVLIGGSYIATEVAASLTELGSSCSLVMLEPVALSRGFGEQAGRFFQQRLEEHGIEVHGDDELDSFDGAGGRVTHVVTKRGRRLEADAVVIGVGAVPDVRLSRTAGLEIGERGGVVVDSRLQTAVPGIFAAGDIAEYESVVHGGKTQRIEHWDVAFNQGRPRRSTCSARTRRTTSCRTSSPTSQTGPRSSMSARPPNGIRRSCAARSTTASSRSSTCKDGRVAAALTVGRSDDLEHASRLLATGAGVQDRVHELEDLSSDLAAI